MWIKVSPLLIFPLKFIPPTYFRVAKRSSFEFSRVLILVLQRSYLQSEHGSEYCWKPKPAQ